MAYKLNNNAILLGAGAPGAGRVAATAGSAASGGWGGGPAPRPAPPRALLHTRAQSALSRRVATVRDCTSHERLYHGLYRAIPNMC